MKKPDAKKTGMFMQFLHTFQQVERIMYAPGFMRKENDVEHSYFLTMLCWYLCDSLELALDRNKVLQYALVHDVAETYAGDTYIRDVEAQKTKKEREAKAVKRIAEEFPEFESLTKTVMEYEAHIDPESAFVYAVDKLEPMITNYLQKGQIWKDVGMEHEWLFAHKREKVGTQEPVRELLEQFFAEMEPRWQEYFTK